ncbi:MAG: aspartate-semialdehyde dehydrogenase [Bacteroidales bacterium]|nr:aspartate-semialdehyde dehydrogenase [Bacteroidales bacterium]MBK7172214.1 aspartate-semialdehyde dehydrogenase [Bacteroidales bacterium]
MKIAVVGATGLVGGVMLKVLEEGRYLPFDKITEIIPVASEKSVGKEIHFNNMPYKIVDMKEAISRKPDIAIFSAGGSISREFAPAFAKVGTTVIDNSSAWRMDADIPLIVPEINASILKASDKIIANPNCSTIQMVLALAPLHRAFGIKRVVVSTYQSVTGTGQKAVQQLKNERSGVNGERVYPHPIDLNLFPHGGTFEANGYTSEETKLVNETRKILGDNNIGVTATVVRVPVTGGHSEAVNVEFEKEFEIASILKLLSSSKGIIVQDEPDKSIYPMPKYAENRDEVFVGRIRRDESRPNTINLWIVADNLRKGAATNAVQIAAYLVDNELVNG